jgi:hypothetical protein
MNASELMNSSARQEKQRLKENEIRKKLRKMCLAALLSQSAQRKTLQKISKVGLLL